MISSGGNGNLKYPIVEKIAKAKQPPILPTETYFVVTTRRIQITKLARAVIGQRAKKTPKAVKTPFPPRKPAKQVKLCPKIAKNPATKGSQSYEGSNASIIFIAINGAKKPLPKSTKITGKAGFQPSTLKTFVRPAFLLP